MSLLVMSYIGYGSETWTDNEERGGTCAGGVVIKGRDEYRGGKEREREGIRGSAIREENNGNDGT